MVALAMPVIHMSGTSLEAAPPTENGVARHGIS